MDVKWPECRQRRDCFANQDGRCRCLTDSDFGGRDCPFYRAGEKRPGGKGEGGAADGDQQV